MAKILFVEDDPLIVKIYSTRLIADGHEVVSADNGEDGLRLATEHTPDLLVLDIMMPKMDGFGVLEQLRKNEKTKNIPILVYSNLAQEEEIERAKKMGATEFIVKANLSPTEMIEKIRHYLPAAPVAPAPTAPPANQPMPESAAPPPAPAPANVSQAPVTTPAPVNPSMSPPAVNPPATPAQATTSTTSQPVNVQPSPPQPTVPTQPSQPMSVPPPPKKE